MRRCLRVELRWRRWEEFRTSTEKQSESTRLSDFSFFVCVSKFSKNVTKVKLSFLLRNIFGTTDTPLFLLGHFPTNECEVSNFCLQLENALILTCFLT